MAWCGADSIATLKATANKESGMCRWMAWLGQPVLIEELLFRTQHGIVDQSLHARIGASLWAVRDPAGDRRYRPSRRRP